MPAATPERFDRAYYDRFYGSTPVHDHERIAHLATAVHHLAAWWGLPVRSVLDVGAGVGLWRDWYRHEHPEVRVRSVDISEHACRTWGHERRDIAVWRPPRPFDLVVCHSVLQYLDDAAVTSAIEHLVGATRHVLYLELPTRADFRHVVDPTGTDMAVHRRSGTWYRRLLEGELRQVGAGLWVRRTSVALFELEAAGR